MRRVGDDDLCEASVFLNVVDCPASVYLRETSKLIIKYVHAEHHKFSFRVNKGLQVF